MPEKNEKNYGYGFYTEEQLEDYYDELIGDYAETLEKETFTDAKKTTYLEAVKYVANLVWIEYQIRQATSHPDQSGALVNVDVLNTVLLSLHPKSKLKGKSLSSYTKEGLAEMQQFQDLIHMDIHKGYDGYGRRSEGASGGHHENMPEWLKNIPDNYTAQLAIMGWFLTITSKMTGYNIPGVGVAPGGIIEQPRDAIAHYLMDMETLADAMAVKKSWDRPQYAILKEMYLDLKRMHYSFRVNRDQKTGEFRPMDGDEDGPKKGNRKDFGHGQHGVGHGHHGVGATKEESSEDESSEDESSEDDSSEDESSGSSESSGDEQK